MNMENIYQDFKNEVVPKMEEWFEMSKEFFTDFFGRYVEYLVLTEWIYLWISVAMTILFLIISIVLYRKYEFEVEVLPIIGCTLFMAFGAFLITISNLTDFLEVLYVPEKVIFEQLKNY